MADSTGTVLVTGGTGFLGGWCVAALLSAATTCARRFATSSANRDVREAVATAGVDADARLTVLAADLTSDDGWAEAVDGCALRAARRVAVSRRCSRRIPTS